jgi:NADP-dependent 3-hydroxy acid dehydrogenase YdfG
MQRPRYSFKDQTVLITGASSGIGREAALAFAGAGAAGVLVARRAAALAKVAAATRKLGAHAVGLDRRDEARGRRHLFSQGSEALRVDRRRRQ